jgi:trehalose synthase
MSPLSLARFAPLIGEARYAGLQDVAARARKDLAGATVWNVNSTAGGGGVAEMLRVLVGYTLDAGVAVRWIVIDGDPAFFATTKRIHNQLHGFPGGGELGPADADHYRAITDALGSELAELVHPGDVVLLHDPQTAGMTSRLAAAGAHVVWRCHVGVDHRNSWTEAAWALLRPHLERCQAFVFSKRSYAPDWLPPDSVFVIPPSIDPFSAKNEELSRKQVTAILRDAGVLGADSRVSRRFSRKNQRPGVISHRATVVRDGGPLEPKVRLVIQVSRWDRLKDMAGVMTGFVNRAAGDSDGAHLALVGPAVAGVSDDPEGAEVLAECTAAWEALAPAARRRVSLVSLPMNDLDENAIMVNAMQRHATIVVQKSLAEGFGLTVAEAMWKGRAVVVSAVGGILDQVVPGTGILLGDPSDLAAFGTALSALLADPAEIATLGGAARKRVLAEFVGDQHLAAYARLMHQLL